MKRFPKTEIISLFSIILGLVGMALQSWLLGEMDRHGLLPTPHLGGTIAVILLIAIIGASIFFLKAVRPYATYRHAFPKSTIAGIGSCVAAVCIALSTFSMEGAGIFRILLPVSNLIAAGALGYAGFCRITGKKPNCLLFAAMTITLILRTMLSCQKWSSETQIPLYFFPLLAYLALLLAAYFRAELIISGKSRKHYIFLRQFGLYCCMVSMVTYDSLFYLAGAIWLATDFCIPKYHGSHAR